MGLGFLVGGPAGAVAGAGLGAKLGGGIIDSESPQIDTGSMSQLMQRSPRAIEAAQTGSFVY